METEMNVFEIMDSINSKEKLIDKYRSLEYTEDLADLLQDITELKECLYLSIWRKAS